MLNRKENAFFNNLSITQKAFHRKLKYNVDFGFLIFILKTGIIIQISKTMLELTNHLMINREKDYKEFIKYFLGF